MPVASPAATNHDVDGALIAINCPCLGKESKRIFLPVSCPHVSQAA